VTAGRSLSPHPPGPIRYPCRECVTGPIRYARGECVTEPIRYARGECVTEPIRDSRTPLAATPSPADSLSGHESSPPAPPRATSFMPRARLRARFATREARATVKLLATNRHRALYEIGFMARASRARARDERVAPGDERIGWGGCGQLVPGCRRVVVSITNPPTAHVSESAGEGVAQLVSGGCTVVSVALSPPRTYWEGVAQLVSGCRRVVVSITNPPTAYVSESAGEGVANWCPGVAESSYRSQTHQLRT